MAGIIFSRGRKGWLRVIYFHRSVLEMEIYFGFYGEGRRNCSRLFPEAGKNYAPGEFNHWASARSFSIGGIVKEML